MSSTGVEEWGMIELQGDIIDKTGGSLNGKVIGDLHFTRQVWIHTKISYL